MISNGFLLSAALLVMSASAWRRPLEKLLWAPKAEGDLHFTSLVEPLKQDLTSPSLNGEKEVDINLYTLSNPTQAQRISLFNDSAFPNFNPTEPTRFLIHGWKKSGAVFEVVRDAYFQMNLDYNVVIVDWSSPAKANYYKARMYTRLVGEYVAQVIQHLVEKKNLNLDNVYVIGHSLGAHVAGVVGNRLDGKLARVVGLDPAGPLFALTPRRNRLDPSDAAFVQVIHTNAGEEGWRQTLGHADFFPNGGTTQPGCGLKGISCSHNRVRFLYADSITSKKLIGTQCQSYAKYKARKCEENPTAIMGEWTPDTTRGRYFLMTNSKPPYGID